MWGQRSRGATCPLLRGHGWPFPPQVLLEPQVFGPGRGEGSAAAAALCSRDCVQPPRGGGQSACDWTWPLPGRAAGHTRRGSWGASVAGGAAPVWLTSLALLSNAGSCGPPSLDGRRGVGSRLEGAAGSRSEDPARQAQHIPFPAAGPGDMSWGAVRVSPGTSHHRPHSGFPLSLLLGQRLSEPSGSLVGISLALSSAAQWRWRCPWFPMDPSKRPVGAPCLFTTSECRHLWTHWQSCRWGRVQAPLAQ